MSRNEVALVLADATKQLQEELVLLTPAEVSEALRVSKMTVYRLIDAGDLPALRIGRSFRVKAEDLDAYLARAGVGQ